MTTTNAFAFPTTDELPEAVAAACASGKAAATVAVFHGSNEFRVSLDDDGAISKSSRGDSLRIPASCVAKIYTATAVVQLCYERGISLDADVAGLLKEHGTDFSQWSGISLRHLLGSTHGLDDPLSIAVPFPWLENGFIDLEGMYTRLNAARRLAPPGEMFSYSDVGSLIAAAVMERLLGRRFEEIVTDGLLRELGIAGRKTVNSDSEGSGGSARFCPTSGGSLTVTATDLLKLARHHFPARRQTAAASADLAVMRANPVGFPGWTTSDRGAGIGWMLFDGGWYGYNAMTAAGSSLLLRFHPESATALAIVSKGIPAHRILMLTFKDLPEAQIRIPRVLGIQEVQAVNCDPYLGRYERSALAVEIDRARGDQISLVIGNRNDAHRVLKQPIERKLRLAEGDGFFSLPLESHLIPHGQFVGKVPGEGRFEYLWSGRHLWRRV